MNAGAIPVSFVLRERIAMTRVVCILGMIYVHVPTTYAPTFQHFLDTANLSGTLQGFLIEGLGRASASLLSLVSGYLSAVALSKPNSSPIRLYERRARSIVRPMLVWSSLTLVIYALASTRQHTFLSEYLPIDSLGDLESLMNHLLFLTGIPNGPTMHLAFLRDLFACILLSPLLIPLIRSALALPVLLVLFCLYLLDYNTLLVLRPLILFAFALGVWLAVRRHPMDRLDAYWPYFLALSALTSALILLFNTGQYHYLALAAESLGVDIAENILYPATRLFGGLAIWTLMARLVNTGAGRFIAAKTPWLFVTYCSHYLVLALLWQGLLESRIGSGPLEVVWFLLAPAISMLVAWAIVEVTRRRVPSLASLLTGGRAAETARSEAGVSTAATTGDRPSPAKRESWLSRLAR